MKLNGLMGKGSGKLGSTVFAISGGEQIVRQYNPVVSNPQTDAQVAQRAKLKLMSQLAAALAPYIAIPKKGLVSARNQFIAKNIGNATYADDTASVELTTLQLTIGSVFLPGIEMTTNAGTSSPAVRLASAAANNIESVAYIVAVKGANDELSVVQNYVCNTAGDDHKFMQDITAPAGSFVIWAYGFTSINGGVNTAYGDYEANVSNDLASLLASRSVAIASGNLTKTVGREFSGH